jgi:aspartyl-tRNA(Asn)/glutamyl-tRNA(Gln) amidotransferase subunit C
MTQISSDDVRRLAQLSNLQLSDEDAANLQADLDAIVGYIAQLGELDLVGVEPTYQVTGLENVWRKDEVNQPIGREELLKLAPEAKNNQVKVPKVL